MVICKKGKDMISCGFKLKTDGLRHLNHQHREELDEIFRQFQAPAGYLGIDKPCRYNSVRHISGKKDLLNELLALKSRSILLKKPTKSRKQHPKKMRPKKTTQKRQRK
mgnify:CR=1 FL=1